MSAVTASLCSTFMFVLFVSADQKNITAESGQDVTLTCRAPNNDIIVLEWSRADLWDENVLLYRDGHFLSDSQHPSFKNRVDLQDRQMKDGDVSLILKDVTTADNGAYKCGVYMAETHSWKLINIIYLHVDPPGQTGGPVGLIVALSVPVVLLLLVAVVGFLIYRKKKLNPADPHELEHLQPEYQKTIRAESGQDVTLTSRAPNNDIRAVKWSRADLGDEYVLWCKGGLLIPDNQHPSFKNRVELQHREMEDGDVSLILKDLMIDYSGTNECRDFMEEADGLSFILKDVTINDSGTYQCRVFMEETHSWKLISNIYLVVFSPVCPCVQRRNMAV